MFTLEVLNPVAQSAGLGAVSGAAPRPKSLDGLTLGLLWNSKRGGEVALAKAAELLKAKYRNLRVIRYDGSMPCDQPLLDKARHECDVFVGSTAD